MIKLYRFTEVNKEYWETWETEKGTHVIHWGKLGSTGETKELKSTLFSSAKKIIQKEIDSLMRKGFVLIDEDNHYQLVIEYIVKDHGTEEDLQKRYLLEKWLNETLGWTGLGHCDGGSMGSGTMEVFNYVVDYDISKKIIENSIKDTEFSNYNRIYIDNK